MTDLRLEAAKLMGDLTGSWADHLESDEEDELLEEEQDLEEVQVAPPKAKETRAEVQPPRPQEQAPVTRTLEEPDRRGPSNHMKNGQEGKYRGMKPQQGHAPQNYHQPPYQRQPPYQQQNHPSRFNHNNRPMGGDDFQNKRQKPNPHHPYPQYQGQSRFPHNNFPGNYPHPDRPMYQGRSEYPDRPYPRDQERGGYQGRNEMQERERERSHSNSQFTPPYQPRHQHYEPPQRSSAPVSNTRPPMHSPEPVQKPESAPEAQPTVQVTEPVSAPTSTPAPAPAPSKPFRPTVEKKKLEEKKFTEADIPEEGPFVMYIANLSYLANSEAVKKHFNDTKILDVNLPYDKENKRTRGFGYIFFEDRESMITGLKKHGSEFLGRSIRVDTTDKDKALLLSQSIKKRQGGKEVPTSEADAQPNWRTAVPKKPVQSKKSEQSRARPQSGSSKKEETVESTPEAPVEEPVPSPKKEQEPTPKENVDVLRNTVSEAGKETEASKPTSRTSQGKTGGKPVKTGPRSGPKSGKGPAKPSTKSSDSKTQKSSDSNTITQKSDSSQPHGGSHQETSKAKEGRVGRDVKEESIVDDDDDFERPVTKSRGGKRHQNQRGRGPRKTTSTLDLELEKDLQKLLRDPTPTTKKTKTVKQEGNFFEHLSNEDA